jgi:hypothetical protein
LLAALIPLFAAAAEPTVPEARLQGTWYLAERKMTVEFRKDPDGTWSAKTVAAEERQLVGRTAFERLAYQSADGCFTGSLIKPEDGSKHDVTVTLASPVAMKAVVRKFLFKKTLEFSRK